MHGKGVEDTKTIGEALKVNSIFTEENIGDERTRVIGGVVKIMRYDKLKTLYGNICHIVLKLEA